MKVICYPLKLNIDNWLKIKKNRQRQTDHKVILKRFRFFLLGYGFLKINEIRVNLLIYLVFVSNIIILIILRNNKYLLYIPNLRDPVK